MPKYYVIIQGQDEQGNDASGQIAIGWEECRPLVEGRPNANYRRFHCITDARYYFHKHVPAIEPMKTILKFGDVGPHKYYVVVKGHHPGIYLTMNRAIEELRDVTKNKLRRFFCLDDALAYVKKNKMENYVDETINCPHCLGYN